MADLDDIRDGKNYGIGEAQKCEGFFLKGSGNLDWGMKDRLSRIFNPATGKSVMLAFDHGFIMGPTSGVERIDLGNLPLIEYAERLGVRVHHSADDGPALHAPVRFRHGLAALGEPANGVDEAAADLDLEVEVAAG